MYSYVKIYLYSFIENKEFGAFITYHLRAFTT